MSQEKYTNEFYLSQLKQKCAECKDEIKGCKAFINQLPEDEIQRLQKLVEETKFKRRRYGDRQFFCWSIHPVFNIHPTDPWPAMHIPRAVLMSEFAIRTPIPT